ncbi:MAG: RHS repeat-associated core domain-containing protein [Prosthecobacter sp.]
MEEKTIASDGPSRKRLEFTYDHLSRRVRKLVRNAEGVVANVASTNWPVTKDRRFIYDGWNMIAEIDASITDGSLALFRSYAWGNDLSGTPQGAGGVGGLLMIQERDLRRRNQSLQITPPAVYAPCYDLNGNILSYIEINRGEGLTHSFEYDAFGKELTADTLFPTGNGSTKENLPFRFSTKYHDDETGLTYYGYRFYNSELGRWLNRDPIRERGGINLYCFVENEPINTWDKLGLESCKIEVRCGPVMIAGINVGMHCGVVANGTEYGIGGDPNRTMFYGGSVPPEYANPDLGPSAGAQSYPATCSKSCCELSECLTKHQNETEPPPYAAIAGPNSNTYAHRLLNACGCTVAPITVPGGYIPTGGYGPGTQLPSSTTTTPPNAPNWDHPGANWPQPPAP